VATAVVVHDPHGVEISTLFDIFSDEHISAGVRETVFKSWQDAGSYGTFMPAPNMEK
jgi:hypothetical protein